jgi:hypothetical protein
MPDRCLTAASATNSHTEAFGHQIPENHHGSIARLEASDRAEVGDDLADHSSEVG